MSATRRGALWVGTEGAGLYCFDRGQWTRYDEDAGLSNLFVWSVAEDASGRIWAGTWGGGLYVREAEAFVRAPGLEDMTSPVPAILPIGPNELWIGTGDGLLHYRGGRTNWYGREQGLELPDVRAVARDAEGTVWFGMLGGGLGRLQDGALRQFRKADGLPSDFVQCLLLDEQDVLWIGTFGEGLCRYKAGRFASIKEMRVDGRPIARHGAIDPALRVSPGRHRLEFDYTALSLASPSEVRFRVRLKGLEDDWIEAGASRSANYNYVPPGRYTFRVIACNNDGVWNQAGAAISFTVVPYFWQTLWFRLSAGAGVVALASGTVWFGTRRRMRRKLDRAERQRAIERERARIAKDNREASRRGCCSGAPACGA